LSGFYSYGIVLDTYSKNLLYIAENAFLEPLPVFKYFNGAVTPAKLMRYAWHDRINFEYAEYCMKTMLWHGSEPLDAYLNSPEFETNAQRAISAKLQQNLLLQAFIVCFRHFP